MVGVFDAFASGAHVEFYLLASVMKCDQLHLSALKGRSLPLEARVAFSESWEEACGETQGSVPQGRLVGSCGHARGHVKARIQGLAARWCPGTCY